VNAGRLNRIASGSLAAAKPDGLVHGSIFGADESGGESRLDRMSGDIRPD
jgi:hypothetical protein